MDDGYNWAALAVPVFLVATLLEARFGKYRGEGVYAFGTAICDLACGSVFQAFELVFKIATFGAYIWIYENARIIDFADGSWVPWALGMLGVDFLFYWWHRISHVVNILWAVHGVHHQSEDYNLAVALRQPIFEPLTWFLFYGVLAWLGVSPVIYVLSYAVNRFYQFWIHTEVVDRGPAPVEWLLNTPSHHRVHHGVEDKYLDRNYGAVLIIWDRLFGSFQPEEERPTYGTTVPLRSYNPLWANFSHIDRIRKLSALAKRPIEKLWAWFAHPAWLPEGATDYEHKPDRTVYEKYRPDAGPRLRAYVVFHFALTGIAMSVVVFFEHQLGLTQLAVAGAALVASFTSFGALIEAKPWAQTFEFARVGIFMAAAAWLISTTTTLPWMWILGGTVLLCGPPLALIAAPRPR